MTTVGIVINPPVAKTPAPTFLRFLEIIKLVNTLSKLKMWRKSKARRRRKIFRGILRAFLTKLMIFGEIETRTPLNSRDSEEVKHAPPNSGDLEEAKRAPP